MHPMSTLRRAAGCWLLFAGLAAGPGCMSFVNPVEHPPLEQLAPAEVLPQCARDHVYIFLVNGLDPGNCSNLTGLRDYCHHLGFQKTYYGQLYHCGHYASEIHRLHCEDPDAHFVLIGFSYGANVVRSLTNKAKEEGITIDLLVYLGGNTLKNDAGSQPENALHIVNILAAGCIWNGATMDRAENYHVTDVWHFGSPTHPQTLNVLARELVAVAGNVPVRDVDPVPVEPDVHTSGKPTEWDFLEPQTRLGGVPARQSPQVSDLRPRGK